MELTTKQRWLVLGALGLLLVVAGVVALRLRVLQRVAMVPLAAPGDPPARQPSPPEHRLAVHVAGAVKHPGVYELEPGARVQDALVAAGGASAAGQPQTLNLAAFLSDGDKLFVPTPADLEAARTGNAPPEAWSATRSAPPLAAAGIRINLNRADRSQLQRLPGVTSTMAGRILQYRDRHGRFDRIDELQQVTGIDPETYARLLPHIYVA